MLLFACTNQKEADELAVIERLTDQWQLKGQPSYESWQKIDDTRFEGQGFTALEKDTSITEKFNLTKQGDNWIYHVNLMGKQNPNEVDFKLDSSSTNTLVFNNPKHDFPQSLVYHWPNDTIMQVTLKGEGSSPVYLVFKRR